MRTELAVGGTAAAPSLFEPRRCFECGDLGFVLSHGRPAECWRSRARELHREPGAAAVLLRRAVEHLVDRGIVPDPQHFEIARLLCRFSTERPFDKARLLEYHYALPLRSFMGVIEDLRKIWLLPVGSRKSPPSGYWICTDSDDFAAWAADYRRSPITQLTTLHRVARRNFPILAEQMELEFWSDIRSDEGGSDKSKIQDPKSKIERGAA